jgi:hypothetical protein
MFQRRNKPEAKTEPLELVCVECGVQTTQLWHVNCMLCCRDCKTAKVRRERFKQTDLEWNEAEKSENKVD